MEILARSLQIEEKIVRYTHINSGSSSVCIMFSGAGYNYNHPLFYYATMTMIEHGIDAVHIHYQYKADLLKTNTVNDISAIMMEEIQPVITDIYKNHTYHQTILLGKSLGTIPITMHLAMEDAFKDAKIVLLTPLLNFSLITEATLRMEQQGLLLIGDKDPHFNQPALSKIAQCPSIQVKQLTGSNHSLDIDDDTQSSIQVLKTVMTEIGQFIR